MDATGSATLLAEARALAATGAWERVHALLAPTARRATPALVLLLAESELRLGLPRAARDRLARVVPRLPAGDDAQRARALNLLGAAHFAHGELSPAEEAFDGALSAAGACGDDPLAARATNNLATIASIRGHRDAALALYRVAIPVYQRCGDARGLAETHHNLAITLRDLGQLAEADRHETRALEFAREAGNARLMAVARAGRAELTLLRGDAPAAVRAAERAVAEYVAQRDRVGQAFALRVLGQAHAATGARTDARAALDAAEALAARHGTPLIHAEVLEARAALVRAGGARAEGTADAAATPSAPAIAAVAADLARAAALYDGLGAAERAAAARARRAELLGGARAAGGDAAPAGRGRPG